jgi:hypothetical protein
MAKKDSSLVVVDQVENKILFIRGEKVILDSDLAALYGVPTSRLNEQVKRNSQRFPPDFMFRLSEKEFNDLKSQFAMSKRNKLKERNVLEIFSPIFNRR